MRPVLRARPDGPPPPGRNITRRVPCVSSSQTIAACPLLPAAIRGGAGPPAAASTRTRGEKVTPPSRLADSQVAQHGPPAPAPHAVTAHRPPTHTCLHST